MTINNSTDNIKFGELVRTIREILGINQTELGRRLNRSGNTISRWELHQITPEDPDIITLALKGLIYEKYANDVRVIDSVFSTQNIIEEARKSAPLNFNRIWLGIISRLNEKVAVLGLDNLQIIRRADKETGMDLVKVGAKYTESGFTYTTNLNPKYKGHDAFLVEQKIEAFLDGADYILRFYSLKSYDNQRFDYFSYIRIIAQYFRTISFNCLMESPKEVYDYLQKNIELLPTVAGVIQELKEKLPEASFKLDVIPVTYTNSNRFHNSLFLCTDFEQTKENIELYEQFSKVWHEENKSEKLIVAYVNKEPANSSQIKI